MLFYFFLSNNDIYSKINGQDNYSPSGISPISISSSSITGTSSSFLSAIFLLLAFTILSNASFCFLLKLLPPSIFSLISPILSRVLDAFIAFIVFSKGLGSSLSLVLYFLPPDFLPLAWFPSSSSSSIPNKLVIEYLLI